MLNAIRQRLSHELQEFAVISAYFFLCFASLAYLKFAILQAEGVYFAPFLFAAGKALICAKFVLVGQALRVGEGFKRQALIWQILYRSLAFWALLLVLNVAEEWLLGMIHHEAAADVKSKIGGGTPHQMIATSIVMLLILIPYFAFRLLGELIGERNLIRLFAERHRSIDKT